MSAAAMPSRCRMPSEYALTGFVADAAETDLIEGIVDATAARPQPRIRAGGIEQLQVRASRQVTVGRRPFDQHADLRQDLGGSLGHRRAEQLDRSARR